jgi:hypothetical protein
MENNLTTGHARRKHREQQNKGKGMILHLILPMEVTPLPFFKLGENK